MGYTKRDKNTINSDIFFLKPDKWFKIWFYIVGEVKFKKYKKRNRGEGRFTYASIMASTKASKDQVYKCLKRLKRADMVAVHKTTRGFNIKVLNYAVYQDIKKGRDDKETTERRQKDDTISKEVEEVEEYNIKRVENFLLQKDGTSLYMVLSTLSRLGYLPAKKETLATFSERLKDTLTAYGIKDKVALKQILIHFYTHHKEKEKGGKNANWKSRFVTRLKNNILYSKRSKG